MERERERERETESETVRPPSYDVVGPCRPMHVPCSYMKPLGLAKPTTPECQLGNGIPGCLCGKCSSMCWPLPHGVHVPPQMI